MGALISHTPNGLFAKLCRTSVDAFTGNGLPLMLRAKPMRNETLYGTEDGLLMNEEVGAWPPDKYKLLQLYAHLFTNGMRGKWSSLTYVDTYSGDGLSCVKGTNQVLLGLPSIALSLDDRISICNRRARMLGSRWAIGFHLSSRNRQLHTGANWARLSPLFRSEPARIDS
jgi:hypothetical protein